MSEKAYAEQISGTVHNELVGTFDKSQTSNRTIEEVDYPRISASSETRLNLISVSTALKCFSPARILARS